MIVRVCLKINGSNSQITIYPRYIQMSKDPAAYQSNNKTNKIYGKENFLMF